MKTGVAGLELAGRTGFCGGALRATRLDARGQQLAALQFCIFVIATFGILDRNKPVRCFNPGQPFITFQLCGEGLPIGIAQLQLAGSDRAGCHAGAPGQHSGCQQASDEMVFH